MGLHDIHSLPTNSQRKDDGSYGTCSVLDHWLFDCICVEPTVLRLLKSGSGSGSYLLVAVCQQRLVDVVPSEFETANGNTIFAALDQTVSTVFYLFTPPSVHTVIRIGRLLVRMPDDKRSQDEDGDDEQPQQPERKQEEIRNRAHEDRAMSGDPGGRLGDLDEVLETHDYPATTNELVEAYGDYEIETQGGTASLEEVLAPTDNQTYDSADDVRSRILGLIHR